MAGLSFELEPDRFCALCGADRETDTSLVTEFLDVVVVTPEAGPAFRSICNACLSMVLVQANDGKPTT